MDLSIGAHLVTPRFEVGILSLYEHHGIYVGRKKVIHFSGMANSLSKGPIEETSMDEFRDSHPCSIQEHRNPKFLGNEAAERAREALEEPSRYNLMFNNCEHFVNWCIEDELISIQSDILIAFATGGVVIGGPASARSYWRHHRLFDRKTRVF